MLQLTLARDNLLVGFDSPMSPGAGAAAGATGTQGSRPAIIFGPARDAHALVTRRMHTMIVVVPRSFHDARRNIVVLSPPAGPSVDTARWRNAMTTRATRFDAVRWVDLIARSVKLPDTEDVCTQTFVPADGAVAKGEPMELDLAAVTVSIESFVSGSALRERWTLAGVDESENVVLVCHWHEPEIGASPLMQTTYFCPKKATLASYRQGVFLGVTAQGLSKGDGPNLERTSTPAHALCASVGELQRNRRAFDALPAFLSELAATRRALGFDERKDKALAPTVKTEKVVCGQTDGLVVWQSPTKGGFELCLQLAKTKEDISRALLPAYDDALAMTVAADRKWCAALTAPKSTDPRLVGLYRRSALVVRQMQDPGGGIIAAPEFQFEFDDCGGYGFCWGRDAGFISLAMDQCGMSRESADFYRYMRKCQSEDGSFLHRHNMDGTLAASWGFLQPDETGSVLFGLAFHLKKTGDKGLAHELRDMVERGGNWLAQSFPEGASLPIPGVDLWEERSGVHLYSVASMVAGLKAACEIFEAQGWSVHPEWRDAVTRYEKCLTRFFTVYPRPARTLMRPIDEGMAGALTLAGEGDKVETAHGQFLLKSEHVVDVSMLAAGVPFEALSQATEKKVMTPFVETIAQRLWRAGIGGTGRYEGDNYRGGNAWVLATLWVALAAARAGLNDLAEKHFAWALRAATPEGLFPEQVCAETFKPAWVMPLTWSHAMFLICLHELPKEVIAKALKGA